MSLHYVLAAHNQAVEPYIHYPGAVQSHPSSQTGYSARLDTLKQFALSTMSSKQVARNGGRSGNVPLPPGLIAAASLRQQKSMQAKAPKQQQQPRRKKQKKRNAAPAPVGNVFDATNSRIPRSLLPVGDGFVVNGLARLDANFPVGHVHVLFVSNVGGTSTMGYLLSHNGSTVVADSFDLDQITTAAGAGGPTSSKACTATAQLCISTQRLNLGGRVYKGVFDQRFDFTAAPSAMTPADLNAFVATIIKHPQMRVDSLENYVHPKRLSVTPTDNQHYDSFYPHRGSISADAFFSHLAYWTGSTPQDRPMSCAVHVLTSPPADQTVNWTVHAQAMTRWPISTVVGQSMKPVPVGSHDTVVKERMRGQDTGGTR